MRKEEEGGGTGVIGDQRSGVHATVDEECAQVVCMGSAEARGHWSGKVSFGEMSAGDGSDDEHIAWSETMVA